MDFECLWTLAQPANAIGFWCCLSAKYFHFQAGWMDFRRLRTVTLFIGSFIKETKPKTFCPLNLSQHFFFKDVYSSARILKDFLEDAELLDHWGYVCWFGVQTKSDKLGQQLCPKKACANSPNFNFVSHLLNLGNTTIADFTAEHNPPEK